MNSRICQISLFVLSFTALFSCAKTHKITEQRIESNQGYYTEILLVDKTSNYEIFNIRYDEDGNIIGVQINDKKRGVNIGVNFTVDNIHSFIIIDDKSGYYNLTNIYTDEKYLMNRQECLGGFEKNETMNIDGSVIVESREIEYVQSIRPFP